MVQKVRAATVIACGFCSAWRSKTSGEGSVFMTLLGEIEDRPASDREGVRLPKRR